MTNQFIRIEHKDGHGMFNPKDDRIDVSDSDNPIIQKLWARHNVYSESGGFPVPCNDGIKKMDSNWFCAFKSLEQFNEWVLKDELMVLFENDFKVYLIEATEIQEGGRQIVYTKESITLKKDISDLFK